MDDVVLDIQNLTVDLPAAADRVHAVANVSLALRRNEILCVVGESGSGKSITARAVMGLLPAPHVRASGGRIMFEGEDLLQVTPDRMRQVRGAKISMIFQEPMTALNPVMTVGNQIDELIAIHTDLRKEKRAQRVIELLAAVKLPDPEHLVRSYPHQLSGGQRQRAMIAMALALKPSVLIADEPTTALDVTTQAQILALIKEIQTTHRTGVLFITHDFGVVADIANRIAVMQFGKVVEFRDAKEVLNAPQHPYTRSLIAAVPKLEPQEKKVFGDEPVAISVINLEKSYRRRRALLSGPAKVVHASSGVSFSIRRGETLGLVGESGSGKSTVARCISRLIKADSGKVLLGATDLQALSRRQMRPYHKRVQTVFQDPYGSLNPRRTIGKLIAEGPMIHGMSESKAHARTHELLELVGLDRRAADRYPHEFSGGQRQRIGIARALALDPEVLIADEPVSALDVSVQAQVLRLLADTRDRLNLTMLFVTHDLRVAAQVCDTIAVMRFGKIVEYGPTVRVFADPQHPYTQELLASVPGKSWTHPALSESRAE